MTVRSDTYKALLALQGGACAGCGAVPEPRRKLYLDHDHLTGIVRGLLCRNCNFALGFAQDDVSILVHLVKYLEDTPAAKLVGKLAGVLYPTRKKYKRRHKKRRVKRAG